MTANSAQFVVREVASDDLDPVHATQKGNLAAFEQLVKRYDRRLLRISQTVTHNREDSEDAVQEALLSAFQNLPAFPRRFPILNLLIRITVNQSPMKLREQRTQKEVSLDEDLQADRDVLPVDVPDRTPNPEQLCWASELPDILRAFAPVTALQ
jgi:RNA polymerase sigma-70 factor, ECF subfamily